jgi:5-methylcytosine-specific restriction enzyme A
MERDGGICHVCGRPGADQVDHVIPLSEGGADDYWNRAPIHAKPCHQEKTQREARHG